MRRIRSTFYAKAPVGATINWGHPLARGLCAAFLINEDGGGIVDAVTGNRLGFVGSGARGTFLFGQGLDCSAANTSGAGASVWSRLSADVFTKTILWRGTIASAGGCPLFGINCASSPSIGAWFHITFQGSNYRAFWNSGGVGNHTDFAPVTAFDGTERQVVVTLANGSQHGYENLSGDLMTTSTQNTNWSLGSSPTIDIGYYPGVAANSQGVCRHAYLWDRVLTRAEVQWLYYEPYAFLYEAPQRALWGAITPPVAAYRYTSMLGEIALGGWELGQVVPGVPAVSPVNFRRSLLGYRAGTRQMVS